MNLIPQKRIEIVVSQSHEYRIINALEEVDVPGFTVMQEIQGSGDQGYQYADDFSGTTSNSYILTAVPPEQSEPVLEKVKPIIEKYGGHCLISDCKWLKPNY